jgi:hypothetical protein
LQAQFALNGKNKNILEVYVMLNENLSQKLKDLGMTEEQITNLEKEGVGEESDLVLLDSNEIKTYTGCGAVVAKKVAAAFAAAGSGCPD